MFTTTYLQKLTFPEAANNHAFYLDRLVGGALDSVKKAKLGFESHLGCVLVSVWYVCYNSRPCRTFSLFSCLYVPGERTDIGSFCLLSIQ